MEDAGTGVWILVLTAMDSARNFPTGGLTLPTRWIKFGFQDAINAKNIRTNRFSPSNGGLACSGGL